MLLLDLYSYGVVVTWQRVAKIIPPPQDSQTKENHTLAKAEKENLPKVVPGRYIVVFKNQGERKISENAAQQAVQSTEAIFTDLKLSQDSLIHQYKYALKGFAAKLTKNQVQQLKEDPRVEAVVQDIEYKAIQATTSPSSTFKKASMMAQTTPWGITRVGGPLSGSVTGKRAWVLDSGIDLDHPDLNVDLTNSKSYISGLSADDDHGHGTHVAGVIAAKNNSIGTVGVAAGATVVALKVCTNSGLCKTSDVDAAFDYIASKYSPGDVANISLAWPTDDPNAPDIDLALSIMESTIEAAADDGLLVTIAAANHKRHANNESPARMNHSNVWTVSAYEEGDDFAVSFSCNPNYGSNYGNPPVDFSAPGDYILSLTKNGGTSTMCGTSQAAPHIAGLLLTVPNSISTDGYVTNDPDNDADPIAAYTDSPYVTGSVQNDHPKLDWQANEGAIEYQIWRKVGYSQSWNLWDTTSSTSYVDMVTSDPTLTYLTPPNVPSGPDGWIAYRVRAVHETGFYSLNSSIHYFEYDGVVVESVPEEEF